MNTFYDANAIYDAGSKAMRGSPFKYGTQLFEMNHLLRTAEIQRDMMNGTYRPGPGQKFQIRERGKSRFITSNTMVDKTVNHLLCDDVLSPALRKYLIYDNELYVIEVNPRASRTIPYISKVTGVPMVDLASQVMLGAKLKDLGYEGGLWNAPHCFAVKVPVFSFEKLSDADSILGPEMKSTGEVLGVGRTKAEALYKGLLAAGFRIRRDDLPTSAGGDDPSSDDRTGVLLSVEDYDHADIIALAGKFFDLGSKLYATPDTAAAIRSTGLDVETAHNVWENNDIYDLVENEKVSCIVYTGAVIDTSVGDFTLLSRKAQQHRIPCLTSIDTASALADILASRYSEASTKLVDICQLDA